MTVNEMFGAAKEQGGNPILQENDKANQTFKIQPKETQFGHQEVKSYNTVFFKDKLWGVNISLSDCKDVKAHHQRLLDLISFIKKNYPGTVTVNKTDELKASHNQSLM
jgi:hypothetical protein